MNVEELYFYFFNIKDQVPHFYVFPLITNKTVKVFVVVAQCKREREKITWYEVKKGEIYITNLT